VATKLLAQEPPTYRRRSSTFVLYNLSSTTAIPESPMNKAF
jgi:hypothetical protein